MCSAFVVKTSIEGGTIATNFLLLLLIGKIPAPFAQFDPSQMLIVSFLLESILSLRFFPLARLRLQTGSSPATKSRRRLASAWRNRRSSSGGLRVLIRRAAATARPPPAGCRQ